MTNADEYCVREPQKIPESYQSLSPTRCDRGKLQNHVSADAVVIGAGVTGNTLAVHLSEAGKSVVQLEASVPGWGGSGRAFGSVVPCHKNSEDAILRYYGEARGNQIIDAYAHGPVLVSELLTRHKIQAEIQGGGWAYGAHTKAYEKKLKDRAVYLQSRGADVEYLSAHDFAKVTGSSYYRAGIIDRRALSIIPLEYCKGLFNAAQELGTSQFVESPAIEVTKNKDGSWTVRTPEGSASAENIYFCTNAYTKGIWPRLDKGFVRVRGWGATTSKIDSDLLAEILPQDHFITDTRHLWSGIRKLPNGQLHLGIGGPSMRLSGKADLKTATERLIDVYPALKKVNWHEGWSGWIAISLDQFPRILQLADGVWAAQGYSGRGLAMLTLLGKELSGCGENAKSNDQIFPVERIPRIPFHKFAPLGAAMLISWYGLMDRFALRKR